MRRAAQLLTGAVAVLISATQVEAKETPPHLALPSYHYGAPIRVECMNRNLYALSSSYFCSCVDSQTNT